MMGLLRRTRGARASWRRAGPPTSYERWPFVRKVSVAPRAGDGRMADDGRAVGCATAAFLRQAPGPGTAGPAGDRLRDGKIVEAWEHYEDTQAWDDFFA